MALFSDREMLKAMEDAVKDKLRKNGLSRVRVSVTGSARSPQVKLDADNEDDLQRAQKIIAD
jgi:hypothetical protein